MICPVCGKGAYGSKQSKTRYNACPSERGCKWRMNAMQAEEWVERAVRAVAGDKRLSEAAIRLYRNRPIVPQPTQDRAGEIKKRIVELDKQERVLVEAQMEAMLAGRSTAVYTTKLTEVNTKRAILNQELVLLQDTPQVTAGMMPLTSAAMIASVLRDVDAAFSSPHLSDFEKNVILSEVVQSVAPSRDGTEAVVTLRPFF